MDQQPPIVVVVRQPPVPARTFHLVMIIATCGAWVPVWFACEVVAAVRRR